MKTTAVRALHWPDSTRQAPAAQNPQLGAPQPAPSVPDIAKQMSNAATLGHRFDQTDVSSASPPIARVTAAGDRHEVEAERAAARIVAEMHAAGASSEAARPDITPIAAIPSIQREASAAAMQGAAPSAMGAEGGLAPVEVVQGIRNEQGGGQALPENIRRPAERILRADLSGVRVHTTASADILNRRLEADAFTRGRDLFFRRDAYAPDRPDGRRLIAHELTHVVQQRGQAGNAIQRGEKNGKKRSRDESSDGDDDSPLTADEVMTGTDMREEMQRAMMTADARFAFQAAQASERPHLHQAVQVRKKPRRMAEVQSASDRLQLAAERRTPGELHYAQLEQSPGKGQAPIVAGRLQDPNFKNRPSPEEERYIYQKGESRPPSYPKEAASMSRMIASEGMTDAEAFEQLGKTMMVEPLDVSPEYHRPLMTTANIIGIAEQRRDPYMGLSSAQTIDHASDPESGLSPADVFGKERKKSKGNDPGMLPASGTGAKEEFSEMRADLEQGHDPSTPAGQRISGNIAKQHLALMRKGFNSEQAQKLLQRGYDRSFVQEAMLARMRSSATRTAAKMTGQLPYNLRSLRRTREDAKDAVKSGRVGKKGKGRK